MADSGECKMPCSVMHWKMLIIHLGVFDAAFALAETITLGVRMTSEKDESLPHEFDIADITHVVASMVVTAIASGFLLYGVFYDYKAFYVPYIVVKFIRLGTVTAMGVTKIVLMIRGPPEKNGTVKGRMMNEIANITAKSLSAYNETVAVDSSDPAAGAFSSLISREGSLVMPILFTVLLTLLSSGYELFAFIWVSLALRFQESPFWGRKGGKMADDL